MTAAIPGYAFCVQGRDGSGYKVSYGFETMEQGHAFHNAVIALSTVPADGLVLVPREPTEAMLSAGSDAGGFDGYLQEQNTPDIWRAMIAAAHATALRSPQVTEEEEEEVERRVEVITNALLHLPVRGAELQFAARQVDLALRLLAAKGVVG